MPRVEKKIQSVKMPKNKENGQNKKIRVSETVKKWAAFLVAHGCTQQETVARLASADCKISQTSVSKAFRDYYNEDSPFPIPLLTTEEILGNARRLLCWFQIDTLTTPRNEIDWKEAAHTQEKLLNALDGEILLKRDEILALQRMMDEEDLAPDILEALRIRHDKKMEQIK